MEDTIMTSVKLRPLQRAKVERWAEALDGTVSDAVRLLIDSVDLEVKPKFVAASTEQATVVVLQT